jgi:Ca2+-binding EF-hand superfamily protein
MRALMLPLAILLGAVSLTAFAQANNDQRARVVQELRSRFAKADTDGDGWLTRDEAKAMPRVASHFDDIDVDRDGKVSMEEIGRYLAAQRGK